MIKALHLFANHKVTGPAELALDTALALEKSRSDWECHFLPAHHPKDPSWLKDLAKEKMARLVEVEGLRLQKHYNPIRAHLDSRILARYLDHHPVDLIHCHLPNDHLVAGAALAARKRNCHPIPIIRTVYDGEPLKPNWRNKKVLQKIVRERSVLPGRCNNNYRTAFGLYRKTVSAWWTHPSIPIFFPPPRWRIKIGIGKKWDSRKTLTLLAS